MLNKCLINHLGYLHIQKQPFRGVLKICSKFTGEHPCQSVISIKMLCNFIEITLRHGYSPAKFLHIFRKPFTKPTSRWLLLYVHYQSSIFVRRKNLCKQSILHFFATGLMIKQGLSYFNLKQLRAQSRQLLATFLRVSCPSSRTNLSFTKDKCDVNAKWILAQVPIPPQVNARST